MLWAIPGILLVADSHLTFESLGSSSTDIRSRSRDFLTGGSADGTVVVGQEYEKGPYVIRDGVTTYLDDMAGPLKFAYVSGVSADGSVIIGRSENEALRMEDGIITGLGDLPGGDEFSSAAAVSADGSVIVGYSSSENGDEAFRWENGMMTGLGDLAGGKFSSRALAVSADGAVIVGGSVSANGDEAFRWEDGTMIGLGDLPGGIFSTRATAVSADGTVIAGTGIGMAGWWRAFIWEDGVLEQLMDEDDFTVTGALSISADGDVITGYSGFPWDAGQGVIWERKNDWTLRKLNGILDAANVDREGLYLLDTRTYDGMTFFGHGMADDFTTSQAYRVRMGQFWGPYPVVDGHADTTPWLGWLYVDAAPWMFSYSLASWLYSPEEGISESGGWVYIPR
ncbi:MAG: hypothetical protein AB3N64_15395 [Puniceicoccaceae bacterium]